MHRHLLVAVVVILGVLLGERDVVQAASFTFTTLDVPGAIFTQAWGINPRGQIVGIYGDTERQQHGFLYDAGVFTTIDVPLGAGTSLLGINPRGQIVGDFSDGGMQRGFLDDAGVFTTLDVPFPDARGTLARGINPRGQIVGFYAVGPPEMADAPVHGFLYDAGVFTTLDVPGAIFTNPWGINPRGQIVGSYIDRTEHEQGFLAQQHGFLYDAGVFTTIDVPFPGAFNTFVFGINPRGQIVGGYSDSTGGHGFVATPK